MRRPAPLLRILFPLALLALPAPVLAAPELLHRGSVVLDLRPLGGDNDREPEPGESFDLALTLGNEGDVTASAVQATLRSNDPGLTVAPAPASVSFPDIAPGALEASLAPHFRLTASAAMACGRAVAFDLVLAYRDPGGTALADTVRFLLFVGEATVVAHEDFDTGPGGWQADAAASTGLFGRWVNAAPQAYSWAGEPAQPGRDVTWPDVSCFFTGQNLSPGTPEFENVDDGSQVLRSRVYDLSGRGNVWLSYHRWFHSDDPAASDSWSVEASADGGASWLLVERLDARANRWTPVAFPLDPLLPLGPTLELRAVAVDGGQPSVCEAAIDELTLAAYACVVDPAEARLASSGPAVDDAVDPLCTDRDGSADAGESFEFSVTVENLGTSPGANVRAALRLPLPAPLTLLTANPVALGGLADNGGRAVASWRLRVQDPLACQTPVALTVDLTADPPFRATPATYPLVLEEDVNQPVVAWRDDFDSSLAPWTVVLYGINNDWTPSVEDCVLNPGAPPTPARNFWYTGDTADPGDCSANPYRADDDSAIRTPRIDTGFANPLLLRLEWNQLLTLTPNDPDAAEVWIDHDDDGAFTRVARYQGLVTTNGDTLDPAGIDLQNNPEGADLSAAAQHVQVEFRFSSDATGGGGSPEALGWIVDNVELTWTDADGRTCDDNRCGSCQANAAVQPSATQACVDEPVTLDGSGSTLTGCPAPGVPLYEWYREGALHASGTPSIVVREGVAATYDYRLDVTCSTDPSCRSSASQPLVIVECIPCRATAALAPAPPRVCAGTPVPLDAQASTVANCPAPGVQEFRWLRDGVPIPGATAATYTANEASAGTYTFTVETSCSSEPACADGADHVLEVDADGTPLPVGNTLLARELGRDVEVTWTDPQPLARRWDLNRAVDKTGPWNSFASPTTTFLDVSALEPVPSDRYYYDARAVSCSGIVGP